MRPTSSQPIAQVSASSASPAPARPASASSLDFGSTSLTALQDVEMPDAGPPTAPLQQSGSSFFSDDESFSP